MADKELTCTFTENNLIHLINCVGVATGCSHTSECTWCIDSEELSELMPGIDFNAFIEAHQEEILEDAGSFEQIAELDISKEDDNYILDYDFYLNYCDCPEETITAGVDENGNAYQEVTYHTHENLLDCERPINTTNNKFEVGWFADEERNDYLSEEFDTETEAMAFYNAHKNDKDKFYFWVTERDEDWGVVRDII